MSQQEIIACLSSALESAQRGELRGLVMVGVPTDSANNDIWRACVGTWDSTLEIVGAVEQMKFEVQLATLSEETETT